MDFLGGENKCGQQLLKLVARGSSIIAELSRLSENIPPVFSDKSSEYSKLLFDFTYLSDEDKYEATINNSAQLMEKDEEFRETHMEILTRFYNLFESIWKYINDLLAFWDDIRNGYYIQQTFESILVNQDGKQLMAESLYLFGVILLQLDQKIPGNTREKMLITFMRYRGSTNVEHLDEVCRLVRNTGFSKDKRPTGYPEDYFARVRVPDDIVDMIIGRIRSDDIYQMAYNFPAPEQRSTALATQAGMLYVLLYFKPKLLMDAKPVMREIVDKHFPDNWIISINLGMTVDLTVEWAGYKAATKAIQNTMQLENVQYYQQLMAHRLQKLMKQLDEYLREGVLNEGYVLDEIHQSLLPCVRNCNVVLRWFLLHCTARDPKIKALVMANVTREKILMLLLKTSQLEYLLREMFTELIAKKAAKWDELKEAGRDKMEKLSQFFSGEGVLASENVEENLAEWFSDIAERIYDLDYESSTQAGRLIQNLITALAEVEEYHQVYSNLQVKQFLLDTRTMLKTMVRYVNIENRVVVAVGTVGDFSYGWNVLVEYIPMIQEKIKRDPSLVIEIRSTFLKLASMMEIPLIRIQEARSLDMYSVGEYYSMKLVDFVRTVLAIIPISMFEQLTHIIRLMTGDVLRPLPTKLPKDQLKEYAQLDERYDLAKTTFKIAKYTEGILAMEKTLMGIIQIEPQKLLEDGIRKVLVDNLCNILHTSIKFDHMETKSDKNAQRNISFEEHLSQLSKRLEGIKVSLEYVQDYMNVYGLKIWQEEFSRLINHAVEMESNNYLTKKVYEYQSRYQSEIRIRLPENPNSNFMGRVLQELLFQTDSRKTTYVDHLSGWYNDKGHAVVSLHTFKVLHSSIGTAGMAGSLRLLSFMGVKDLQLLRKVLAGDIINPAMRAHFGQMNKIFNPPSSLPKDAKGPYQKAEELGKRVWPPVVERIVRIGRCQLIKKQIQKTLQFACKLDSAALYNALQCLNAALLSDVQAHYKDPDNRRYPNGRKPIMPEITEFLEKCGMNDAFTQIYITAEPITNLALMLSTLVVVHLGRFHYDPQIDVLTVRKKDDVLDGAPFVVGIVTILKQFHSDEKDVFVAYLCQYCRSVMSTAEAMQAKLKEKDKETIPHEVCNCLLFLESFCKYAAFDKKQIENLLPPFLVAKYREYAAKLPMRK
eukprot:TRINITY_DN15897_c0_g1_i1.p1 TRINITY_DN15897_c0_g1~~TRINITY_DN15897_c0_g1_i1.p1  ORF type:complete len:1161 (+),score=596.63 TRINITY_DN15897_c0_g1_i1:141-3623(+)